MWRTVHTRIPLSTDKENVLNLIKIKSNVLHILISYFTYHKYVQVKNQVIRTGGKRSFGSFDL